jgi:hypothetical protein
MERTTQKTSLIVMGSMISIGMLLQTCSASAQTPPATTTPAKTSVSTSQPASPRTAQEALDAAQKNGEFLAVIFFDQKNDLFKNMEQTVVKFQKESKAKIRVFHAFVKDKAEAPFITKHRIDQAKLPLALVFASNGAITGGFEQKVTADQLRKTLVSELVAKIIKAVHEQKIVVVALQNSKTKFNAEASKVADEFANDPTLKGHVEILQGDPDDLNHQEFLTQCEVRKPVTQSTLILLAPPSGTIMGTFSGDSVTKDDLIKALTPPSSGCCPGGGSCK